MNDSCDIVGAIWGRDMRSRSVFFRRPVVWLLLVYLIGGAPRAWAQSRDAGPDEAKKSAARAKLVEGDGFLKQGDHQQALAAFKAAFALFPSPKIQYDFGLAYRGMDRNAEALESFEAFLKGSPDAQPDVLAKARGYRDALLGRVGLVRVTSEIAGASIFVDGREIGKTQYTHDFRLDPGQHFLLVDRGSGTTLFTQRLDVVAGGTLTVAVRFPTAGSSVQPSAAPAATAPPLAIAGPADGQVAAPASPARVETDTTTGGAQQASSPGWVRPATWTAGGLTLASLAIGAVGWTIKESKYNSFNNNTSCDKAFANDGGIACHDLLSTGNSAKAIGIMGFVSGGVFGAISAALFLWGRASAAEPARAAGAANMSFGCGPMSGASLGGLCGVRF